MFESVLEQFEHDANDGTEPPVADYQSFEPPTEEVSWNENVKFIL